MAVAANSGMENQELGEWEDPWGAVSWTAEWVSAEAEAGKLWGDVSGVTDFLWPWAWPEQVTGWVGSQTCIFQWGRVNDEWGHFSAFQHGWLKYDSDTTLSWWLLLYFCTGGCEISRTCRWGGQLLPFHPHLFQVSSQGSEALPKR